MAEETATVALDDFQAYKADRVAKPTETPAEQAAEPEKPTETEAAETVEPEKPETPEAEEGKKKGGWQRRIEKLEREKQELEKRISEREQKPVAQDAVPAKQATPNAEGRPEKPKLEQFDSYDKFQDAQDEYLEKLQDWKLEQFHKQQQRQAVEAKTNQTWQERLTAAKARISDFDEVVQGAIADHDVQVSPAMAQAIQTSEQGPDVVYWLAKHPDEAARIAKLSPLDAALAIGRIEAKVTPEAEPEKPAKKVSAAPAPVKPVGHRASTGTTLDDAGDDYQKYKAARNKTR